MVGLTPVVALVAVFVWLGLSARDFDRQTRQRLFVLIAAVVILDLARGAL